MRSLLLMMALLSASPSFSQVIWTEDLVQEVLLVEPLQLAIQHLPGEPEVKQ